jgi:hypothetical protein
MLIFSVQEVLQSEVGSGFIRGYLRSSAARSFLPKNKNAAQASHPRRIVRGFSVLASPATHAAG